MLDRDWVSPEQVQADREIRIANAMLKEAKARLRIAMRMMRLANPDEWKDKHTNEWYALERELQQFKRQP